MKLPLVFGGFAAASLSAAFSSTTSLATFNAWAPTNAVEMTFEGPTSDLNIGATYSEGGHIANQIGSGGLYIATPGGPADAGDILPTITSNILVQGGDEDFEIVFDGLQRAVGMDTISNTASSPIQVNAYDSANLLVGTVFVPADATLSFLGLVHDAGISRITWFGPNAGQGTFDDTGIDNVRVEAVPEPATLAVLGLGAMILRRRRA